jgi:leucine dehydrogenase
MDLALGERRLEKVDWLPMGIHILDAMSREGFEEVIGVHDRKSGLRALIAIHDTSAGPAFGGIRRWSYLSERAALMDCLRLARAMTYKCVLAGIPGGGAKAVVLDDPALDIEGAYRHLGKMVEGMNGRFYTGPDVGTDGTALDWLSAETSYVTRTGPEGPGDLGGATAAGAFAGIRAGLRHIDGEVDWSARKIVIQGLGEVGAKLASRLIEVGATVVGTDIDTDHGEAVARRLGFEFVEPSTEIQIECDVFAPCALGGILHDVTIERLRTRIVAGAANNVLAKNHHGDMLHGRGVLYLPDFVLNAGALIRGAFFHLENRIEPLEGIETRIESAVDEILTCSQSDGIPPFRVAISIAESRLAQRRGDA